MVLEQIGILQEHDCWLIVPMALAKLAPSLGAGCVHGSAGALSGPALFV